MPTKDSHFLALRMCQRYCGKREAMHKGLFSYIIDEATAALADLAEHRMDAIEGRLHQIRETAEIGRKDEQEERRLESGYESRGVLRKDR